MELRIPGFDYDRVNIVFRRPIWPGGATIVRELYSAGRS